MGWQFVGRRSEMESATMLLRDPSTAGVFVVGDAGVGKSRLLAELADDAAGRGWTIWRLRATQAARSVPFSTFDELLPLGSVGPDPHRHLVGLAREQAGLGPLLVAIDDAHLLDPASEAVVERLSRVQRVRLALSAAAPTPCHASIVSLWKEGLLDRIELGPLGRPGFEQLIDSALAGPMKVSTVQALWELTRGNPRYLRTILDSARGDGSLTVEDGRWGWDASTFGWSGLRDLVGVEFDDLPSGEIEALELVALGEPLPVDVATAAIGDPALAALERRGLVRYAAGTTLSTRHPVLAATIEAAMGPATRRRRAETLAKAWEAHDGADALLQAARWIVASGGRVDPVKGPLAAHEALKVSDFALAERLARAGLDTAPRDVRSRVVLADALRHLRRPGEALAELVQADGYVDDDDRLVADIAVLRAEIESLSRGRLDAALSVLADAAARVSDETAASRIAFEQTYLGAFAGDFAVVVEAAKSVVAMPPDESDELSYLLVVLLAQALALELAGSQDRLARARHLVDGPADVALTHSRLAVNECLITVAQGRVGAAHADALSGLVLAVQSGQPTGLWGVSVALTGTLAGDLDTAVKFGSEAVESLRSVDPFGVLGFAASLVTIAAYQSGSKELGDSLASVVGPPGGVDPRARAAVDGRVQAWRLVLDGKVGEAATVVAGAGRAAVGASHRLWGAISLHEAVRLGRPELVVDDLARLAAATVSPLVDCFAEHAAALCRADGQALDEVATAFSGTGALVLALDASAQAAAAHAAGSAASVRAATRAAFWRDACGGIDSPAVATMPAALTVRQRQVARLAARGVSSRSIADQLVLSRRTVDNHLGRIYAALGVGGRDELTTVLAPVLELRAVEYRFAQS